MRVGDELVTSKCRRNGGRPAELERPSRGLNWQLPPAWLAVPHMRRFLRLWQCQKRSANDSQESYSPLSNKWLAFRDLSV
jgi:hypothetical protein